MAFSWQVPKDRKGDSFFFFKFVYRPQKQPFHWLVFSQVFWGHQDQLRHIIHRLRPTFLRRYPRMPNRSTNPDKSIYVRRSNNLDGQGSLQTMFGLSFITNVAFFCPILTITPWWRGRPTIREKTARGASSPAKLE